MRRCFHELKGGTSTKVSHIGAGGDVIRRTPIILPLAQEGRVICMTPSAFHKPEEGGYPPVSVTFETGEGDSKDINWCSVGQRRETHVPDPVTSKRAVTSKDRGDTTSFCETKGRHRHICKTQSHLNRQLTGRTPIGLPQAGRGRHICRTQSHLDRQLTGRTPIGLPQVGGRHLCRIRSHPDGQLMGRTPIGLRPNPYQGQAH